MTTTIFVPTQGSPFITNEEPNTIVGGNIEGFTQVEGIKDLIVHPLFTGSIKDCELDDDDKRWAVVNRILKRKNLKKDIWLNEDGAMKCCPNNAMICLTNQGNYPLFGDICIQMKTKTYDKHFKDLLPFYRTFEDYRDDME